VEKQGLRERDRRSVNGLIFPTRNSIPSGPRRKNSACPCSSIRRAFPRLSKRLLATAGSATPSAILSTRRSALAHHLRGHARSLSRLKLIAAHGAASCRLCRTFDHACMVGPKGCNPDIKLRRRRPNISSQIYFDSLVFSPEAIRHLAAQVGAGQIVLAATIPILAAQPVDSIFASDITQRRREPTSSAVRSEAVQFRD